MRRFASSVLVAMAALLGLALVGCGSIPPTTAPEPPSAGAPEASPEPVEPTEPAASSSAPSEEPAPAPEPSEPATSSPEPEPAPTQPPKPAGPDCKKLKCIALTYDDGPFPDETGELLETLRRYKAKATFFMLGQNVKAYPDTVKEIVAAGSELANHSWGHPSLPGLGNEGMRRELQRTNDAIEKATGVRVTMMRPPYGANNKRLDRVTRELGMSQIYWDVDTLDWKFRSTGRLVDYVLSNAERNQVVLMHDIHFSTVKAAPAIIRGLQKRGYTLVTVSELYPTLRPGGRYPEFGGRGYAKKSDYIRKRS